MNKKDIKPFQFCTRQNLTYLTGQKARTLKELYLGIKEASCSTIYCHTHYFLQQHEFMSPEPRNDFSYWIRNSLQDKLLGEMVASIDFWNCLSIEEIQKTLIETIENVLPKYAENDRTVPEGEEFHFMEAQTFVFQTKHLAYDLNKFLVLLENVSIVSIYHHMFESRLRLKRNTTDFSQWLKEELEEEELSEEFIKLDPYTFTLDNLRKHLARLVRTRLKEITDGSS